MPYSWQKGASPEEIVYKTLNMKFEKTMRCIKFDDKVSLAEKESAKDFYEMKHISGVKLFLLCYFS